MCRHPVGCSASVRSLADPSQRREHVGHALGMPSTLVCVLCAKPIGLNLGFATELEKQQPQARAGGVCQARSVGIAHLWNEDLSEHKAKLRAARPGVGLGSVTRRHVPNFVSEDAREGRLVLQIGHDAPRDIDVSARERKRVDGRRINDRELPRQVWPMRDLCQRQADLLEVPLECDILVLTHLLQDLGVGLLTNRDLLSLAHERELTFTGHGIGRTCDGQDQKHA